ncbi:MAG TPA: hypothetical protein VFA18_04385, partial [Gemmataceae bacterium]|nr:hypothetical protein [Gemmataceae bacterium]
MRRFSRFLLVASMLACVAAAAWLAEPTPRGRWMAAYQAGNYRDAYDGLRKLALDPNDDPRRVGEDLTTALSCLQQLGRQDESDDFLEAVIAVHKKNWRLLEAAAESYAADPHFGFIVAGKFHRGGHRGGGRLVNSIQRDRVRALQLMEQAQGLISKNASEKGSDPLNSGGLTPFRTRTKNEVADFYLHFAHILRTGGGRYESWRLQYLTDLTQLPDYEEGYSWWVQDNHPAPVDADGKPLFYHAPKSYQTAASDGERWRWLLTQAAEAEPGRLSEVELIFADFMRSQFGVQTLAYYGAAFQPGDTDTKSGIFALHTLHDDETIARLANGIKRFKLPDEFNWIRIYKRIAERGRSDSGEKARDRLANVYADRRQFDKAAAAWKQAIAEYGAGANNSRRNQLDQIVGNWGRFESGEIQPAGQKATVSFRFRNGHKVSFEAQPIDVAKLLEDLKAYLKSNPKQLDWNQLNLSNIGYRLVDQNQAQYVGDKVAAWDMDLKPRPGHVDDRVTVTTPLTKAGAYLVTATMADGN